MMHPFNACESFSMFEARNGRLSGLIRILDLWSMWNLKTSCAFGRSARLFCLMSNVTVSCETPIRSTAMRGTHRLTTL